jgi:hypothetical protein
LKLLDRLVVCQVWEEGFEKMELVESGLFAGFQSIDVPANQLQVCAFA